MTSKELSKAQNQMITLCQHPNRTNSPSFLQRREIFNKRSECQDNEYLKLGERTAVAQRTSCSRWLQSAYRYQVAQASVLGVVASICLLCSVCLLWWCKAWKPISRTLIWLGKVRNKCALNTRQLSSMLLRTGQHENVRSERVVGRWTS